MQNKLKILVITLEPPDDILGGMGEHIRLLYRAMAEDGLADIRVATVSGRPGRYNFYGYQICNIDNWVPYKLNCNTIAPTMALFQSERKLQSLGTELINEERPDIIHYHEVLAAPIGEELKRIYNIPTVGTIHLCQTEMWESKDSWDLLDFHYKAWEGRMIELSNEFIAISKDYAQIPKRWYMCDRPVNTIHNGVWYEDWAIARGEKCSEESQKIRDSLPKDKKIVLFVGRIAEQKGIEFIPEIIDRTKDYCFVLMGDLNAHNLEKTWEEWKPGAKLKYYEHEYPDNLKLIGFKNEPERQHWFAAADCVFMPSIHEPFGIVALEAMAADKPLICTSTSGLAEFTKHQENAYVCDMNADSLRNGLDEVMNSQNLREHLIRGGCRTAKKMDWHKVANAVMKVYRKAIGDHNADSINYTCNDTDSNHCEDSEL